MALALKAAVDSSAQGTSADRAYHLPPTNPREACTRCLRALNGLIDARKHNTGSLQQTTVMLEDALKTTAFGQAVEAGVVNRLVPVAEYASFGPNTTVDLHGVRDALYVVLTGTAEILRGPQLIMRVMTLTVECARGLMGDSAADSLDPYCIVRIGGQEFKTNVEQDAGVSPTWNWSTTVVYNGEPEIEFTVMEYDQFSKHSTLGVASLSSIDFTGPEGFESELSLSPPDPSSGATMTAAMIAAIGKPATPDFDPEDVCRTPPRSKQGLRRASMVVTAQKALDCGKLTVRVVWSESPKEGPAPMLPRTQSQSWQSQASSTMPKPEGMLNLGATGSLGGPSPRGGGGGCPKTPSAAEAAVLLSSALAMGGPGDLASRSSRQIKFDKQGSSKEPLGDSRRGEQLGPGQHFGAEDGGGAIRTLQACEFLVVPRAHVSEAFRAQQAQRRQELDEFLRRHVPGIQRVDLRAFQTLASAFQELIVPRGHVLCGAGAPSEDAKRVYLIREGTCSLRIPQPCGAEDPSSPPRQRSDGLRSTAKAAPLGLLGPGATVGFASALFSLDEPFSVVAEETLKVLWISVDQRPFSTWPRDVIIGLRKTMSARTDWHVSRTKNVKESIVASNALKCKKGDRMPVEWTADGSPKLKHKNVTRWRSETLRDLFDSQGWSGGPAAAKSPSQSTSAASSVSPSQMSSLHASAYQSLLASQVHTPGMVTPAGEMLTARTNVSFRMGGMSSAVSMVLEDVVEEEGPRVLTGPGTGHKGGAAPRGIYAVNSGLGRCQTPWGTWTPSGMLPPASSSSACMPGLGPSPPRKRRVLQPVTTHGVGGKGVGPAGGQNGLSSGGEESEGDREVQTRKVNLKCPSEWQRISGIASATCLKKMYRQQVRTATVMGGSAFASSSQSGGVGAGGGISRSSSEGAVRSLGRFGHG
mmetsp:Transcript_76230/g.218430  ORF Transcript_76230/g.218430 Transcript_76230/m.218430 type:complete len:924 (-) Transcript_76230:47-2818(-)